MKISSRLFLFTYLTKALLVAKNKLGQLARFGLFSPARYQDCPHCGTVIRAGRTICPACAKYL